MLDSGFHAVDFEFQVLDSLSLKLGIRIAIVTGISDSLTCIPDSKAQESGSHDSNFPDSKFQQPKISRNPDSKSKISRIPDSTSRHFTDSLTSGDLRDETESDSISVITVTKKRLIILITLHMLNNYWMRFL